MVVTNITISEEICKFKAKFKEINLSKYVKCIQHSVHVNICFHFSCRLSNSLRFIRDGFKKLDHQCKQLDMTVQSPFIKGDWYLRPLSYIRETLNDLYEYFYNLLSKHKCWAQLIEITSAEAIEDYQHLITPEVKYENHLIFIRDGCKCRRCNKSDWIESYTSCSTIAKENAI